MSEQISGPIERVTYHNPENGFAVLRVRVRGQRDPVTVTGRVTAVTAGEHLEASGRWVLDREHGRQFKADTVSTSSPATAEGIERYLASGAVRGIGPTLAARLVTLYGDRTLWVLDRYSEVLLHVRGIGPGRLRKIRAGWAETKAVREIMLFLHSHGIGSGRAVRIYKTYGETAIATVKADPYRLAEEIRGIGFKTADELASRLGLAPDSPQRARAAVRHVLQELTTEGHCGYPEELVVDKTAALVEITAETAAAAVAHQLERGALVREEQDGRSALYLAPLHRAEMGLAESVRRIAAGTHPLPPGMDVEAELAEVESKLQLRLAETQREAVLTLCRQPLAVITGGPGVGKTTLVRTILELFERRGVKSVLAAPTGRAAKRLSEATGRPAGTLHRLLGFEPGSGGFERNARRPLDGGLFVLDEASMVDLPLAYQFLRAVPQGACVAVVGDPDQLPSVGPGAVLADLIASETVPVVRLTQVFRQAEQSRIVRAAHAVNAGRLPDLSPRREQPSDFYFAEADEPERVEELLVRIVRERIPETFGLDPLRDVQVLTPMNRSLLGSRNLNRVLQAALNPAGRHPEIERFGWTFRPGDKVIQTENDYDRDVFNGDLGHVERVDAVDQELTVRFEDRGIVYDFGSLDALAPAYALSVHKSQGSEYPCVVIPVHTQHYPMLRRNLIYTAVTRGRRLVVLIGSRRSVALAVRRTDDLARFTGLRRRLRDH